MHEQQHNEACRPNTEGLFYQAGFLLDFLHHYAVCHSVTLFFFKQIWGQRCGGITRSHGYSDVTHPHSSTSWFKCQRVHVLCPQLSPSRWVTAWQWRKCSTAKGNPAWTCWRPTWPRRAGWRRLCHCGSSTRGRRSCVRRKPSWTSTHRSQVGRKKKTNTNINLKGTLLDPLGQRWAN